MRANENLRCFRRSILFDLVEYQVHIEGGQFDAGAIRERFRHVGSDARPGSPVT
jgi:hypothetical protein